MHPRPLYRWKSFWFGVLFFAFLGWASWDSKQFVSGGSQGELNVFRRDSRTILMVGPHFAIAAGFFRHPASTNFSLQDEIEWFVDIGTRVWVVHDDVLAFPLFISWLGWLAWRWRRQGSLQAFTPA